MKSEVQVLPAHHPASDQRIRGPASCTQPTCIDQQGVDESRTLSAASCLSDQHICWPLGALPGRLLCCTAVVERITSRADLDAARRAARIADVRGRRCQRDGTELAALWSAA